MIIFPLEKSTKHALEIPIESLRVKLETYKCPGNIFSESKIRNAYQKKTDFVCKIMNDVSNPSRLYTPSLGV